VLARHAQRLATSRPTALNTTHGHTGHTLVRCRLCGAACAVPLVLYNILPPPPATSSHLLPPPATSCCLLLPPPATSSHHGSVSHLSHGWTSIRESRLARLHEALPKQLTCSQSVAIPKARPAELVLAAVGARIFSGAEPPGVASRMRVCCSGPVLLCAPNSAPEPPWPRPWPRPLCLSRAPFVSS